MQTTMYITLYKQGASSSWGALRPWPTQDQAKAEALSHLKGDKENGREGKFQYAIASVVITHELAIPEPHFVPVPPATTKKPAAKKTKA